MANLRVNETPVLVANDGTGAIIVNNGTSTVWITTDATNKGGFILEAGGDVDQLPEGDIYAYTTKGMKSTVYTSDPAITDTCLGLDLDNRNVHLQVGSTTQVVVSPVPAHAPLRTLTATSKTGDTAVTVAGGNIEIEALAVGSDEITITDGFTEVKVFVSIERQLVTAITIDNPTDFTMLEVGEPVVIQASVVPAGAIQDFGVTVDDSTYQVQGHRIIASRGGRPATITVRDMDGNEATVNTNSKVSVKSIEITNKIETLWVGDEYKLKERVLPDEANDKTVTWESSDENIMTVSNQGLVTTIIPGTATITVTTDDGNFTDTVDITVE